MLKKQGSVCVWSLGLNLLKALSTHRSLYIDGYSVVFNDVRLSSLVEAWYVDWVYMKSGIWFMSCHVHFVLTLLKAVCFVLLFYMMLSTICKDERRRENRKRKNNLRSHTSEPAHLQYKICFTEILKIYLVCPDPSNIHSNVYYKNL